MAPYMLSEQQVTNHKQEHNEQQKVYECREAQASHLYIPTSTTKYRASSFGELSTAANAFRRPRVESKRLSEHDETIV